MARTKTAPRKTAKPSTKRSPRNAAKIAREPPREPDSYLLVRRSGTGVRVDHDNALQFAAVWACVRFISQAIASMPWNVVQQLENGGRKPVPPTHPIHWILHTQPNLEMTAFTLKELLLSWALTWGNGYAEIERDRAGRVVWLWPLCPDRVKVGRTERGELIYRVSNHTVEPTYLWPEDIFHLKGLSFDGLVGYSVVNMAARTIGYGFDLESEGDALTVNDSTPGGVLTHPGRMSQVAQERLRANHQKVHGGPKNKGKLLILEEGMQYQGIGLPHKDTQFLENRKFQVTEIARWFGVPPHIIADLERSTNNNIEEQGIAVVQDCLVPWVLKMEQEADWKLFGRQQQGVYTTKINVNARMRGRMNERADYYRKLWDMGVFDCDEIRQLEDMNPVGEAAGGRKRLVQLNLTTLEKVGEDAPEPPPEPVEPAREEGDSARDGSESTNAAKTPLDAWFLDAATAITRREQHRVKEAAQRFNGNADGFNAWLTEFFDEHRNYAQRKLMAPAQSLAGESEELNTALALCIEKYIHHRQNLLKNFGTEDFCNYAGDSAALAQIAKRSAEIVKAMIVNTIPRLADAVQNRLPNHPDANATEEQA